MTEPHMRRALLRAAPPPYQAANGALLDVTGWLLFSGGRVASIAAGFNAAPRQVSAAVPHGRGGAITV